MRRFVVYLVLSLVSCTAGCLPVPPVISAVCHEEIRCALSMCGNGVVEAQQEINGVLYPGEECDNGDQLDWGDCNHDCTRKRDCATLSECGNGLLELGEGCDDGNTISTDGCSDTCADESLCGNAVVNDGEECDDGNFLPRDGCESNCTIGPDFFP